MLAMLVLGGICEQFPLRSVFSELDGFCVWLLEMTVLFIVWLFTVPVSCACTLSMSALWVEMHTFKRNVEGFSL